MTEYEDDDDRDVMMSKICFNKRNDDFVDEGYINLLSYSLDFDEDYDAIFITKNNKPSAYVVTEKGYCKKRSDAHVLHLMCSNDSISSRLAMKSYIFVICYNYIVNGNRNAIGILNLEKGFEHSRGFCLYSKYGFRSNAFYFNSNNETYKKK